MSVFEVTQNRYNFIEEKEWEEEKRVYFTYLYNKIMPFIRPNKGKLLDVGCGLGTWASYLKSKLSFEIYGIEMSPDSLEVAKKNGLSMKLSDIENKWPYSSSSFEMVSAIQLVEHLLNTDIFFQESHRVLKRDGYLLITTPNLASWLNRIIFIFGFQPFTTEVSTVDKTFGLKFTRKLSKNRTPVGHIRSFTLKALIDILEYYNFKIVKVVGGKVDYLPKFLKPLDLLFSHLPSLASDIIVIAKKR